MSSWVEEELSEIKLPDTRLKRRLQIIVEKLAEMPQAPIPQAMGCLALTKGTYRFLESNRITAEAIRAGWCQATLQRVAQEKRVLLIQDTTLLDYTRHRDTRDLGYLALPGQRGIVMHSTLACTTSGIPLGILDQTIWKRDLQELGKRQRIKKRTFAEKESFKWVKGLQDSTRLIPETVASVTIADCEADIFELFAAARLPQADLLIRACRDRRLEGEEEKLWQTVMAGPIQGQTEVKLEARPQQPARVARCSINFQKVTLSPANYSSVGSKHQEGVTLYAVLVREEEAPAGVSPLEWMLLTTLPVESLEEALQCIEWYKLRWVIEQYHFTLKSGCQIEKLQLESAERLERAIALYSIVAWRLLWLKYAAREWPEASCEVALEKHEWQALYCKINRTSEPPLEPPGLRQAVRWIAQLGGFLGRKSDGEPGVKTLWRGWRRLEDLADAWLIFRPAQNCG